MRQTSRAGDQFVERAARDVQEPRRFVGGHQGLGGDRSVGHLSIAVVHQGGRLHRIRPKNSRERPRKFAAIPRRQGLRAQPRTPQPGNPQSQDQPARKRRSVHRALSTDIPRGCSQSESAPTYWRLKHRSGGRQPPAGVGRFAPLDCRPPGASSAGRSGQEKLAVRRRREADGP